MRRPDTPLNEILRQEAIALVREELARRCHAKDAHVIIQYYAFGCSTVEIAAELGVSVSMIGVRRRRGLDMLAGSSPLSRYKDSLPFCRNWEMAQRYIRA